MNIIISVSIYNRTNQKCSLEASWIKGHFFYFEHKLKQASHAANDLAVIQWIHTTLSS